MLKTVIKKKTVDALSLFEPMAFGEPVFAYSKGNAILKAKSHQLDFIACSFCAAVATAEYRHSLPFREKLFSEPDHHGRLPRASDSKIPNADDRAFQPLLPQPTMRG